MSFYALKMQIRLFKNAIFCKNVVENWNSRLILHNYSMLKYLKTEHTKFKF